MSEAWFKQRVGDLLAGALGEGAPEAALVAKVLGPAKKAGQGDYAFPCFVLAKALRKSPAVIAAELVAAISDRVAADPQLSAAEAAGPYVNVFVDPAARAQVTLEAIEERGVAYGRSDMGGGPPFVSTSPRPISPSPLGSVTSGRRSSGARSATCTGRVATSPSESITSATGASSLACSWWR